jgi:hypothetical protein
MMLISSSLLGTLLTAVGAGSGTPVAVASLEGPASRPVAARIWVENEPAIFRRGDRMDVRFSVSDDAYVAILHIDTEGNLDFLYPTSPWDSDWVRGGRIYTLPFRGTATSFRIGGGSGIGYFYILASPTPLDYFAFGGRSRSSWDWGYAGRRVYGDPFVAFDQITRLLLPRWPHAPYGVDYYGYHVGGIHRYPAYACSDRYAGRGWGWTPSYGPCSRLDLFLRAQPYYFDTRRFAGDRRLFLRQFERLDPRHGFKEDPEGPARRLGSPRQDLRGGEGPGVALPAGEVAPRRQAAPRGTAPVGEARPPPATSRQPPPPDRTGTSRERPQPASRGSSGAAPQREAQPPSGSGGQAQPAGGAGRERPQPSGNGSPPAESPGATPQREAQPPSATGRQAQPASGTGRERPRPAATGSSGATPQRARPGTSTARQPQATGRSPQSSSAGPQRRPAP